MKKSWKIILILVGVIVVLIILVLAFGNRSNAVKVDVEKVSKRDITEVVSASGKIQPETEVNITSEVSGQIIELPVKEGDVVMKGDLLLKINPDIYEAAVNRAFAGLNTAKSNLANAQAREAQVKAQFLAQDLSFKRNKSLHEKGAISDAEWDNALSAFQVAEAEVIAAEQSVKAAQFSINSAEAGYKEASDNLKRTTILAPQDGTVTALTKEAGEGVLGNQMMAGEIIMKISDLSMMEVDVEVNESDIVRVSLGDTAEVEVDAYIDEVFEGVVSEIGNTALNSLSGLQMSMDQVTNFSVKIRILRSSYESQMSGNPESFSPFRPGMSATVDIKTEQSFDVISVPIKAVTTREDTTSLSRFSRAGEDEEEVDDTEKEPITLVFVLNETTNRVKTQAVETGIQDSQYIEIKEGLEEGEKVITGPYDQVSRKLTNNKHVEVKSKHSSKDEEEQEE